MIGEHDPRGRIGLHHDVVVLAPASICRRLLVDILSQHPLFALRVNAHPA